MKVSHNSVGSLRDICGRMHFHWQLLFFVCCVVGIVVWGRANLVRGGAAMLGIALVFFLWGPWELGVLVTCWIAIAYLNNVVFYRWIVRHGQRHPRDGC